MLQACLIDLRRLTEAGALGVPRYPVRPICAFDTLHLFPADQRRTARGRVQPQEDLLQSCRHPPIEVGREGYYYPNHVYGKYSDPCHINHHTVGFTVTFTLENYWTWRLPLTTFNRLYTSESRASTVGTYPPRRRLTLDYRKVNSVVQVDAARIPDVKETVQSLRVLAGESQRQVNARRNGTRTSIHDHDAAASWNLNADKLPDPEDYLCASIDLVHAFHQLVLSEEDRPKWAFGNRDLGCWCFTRAPQGAKGSPASWYNYCAAVLQAHGCLHTPDFDVADLEKIDKIDYDTDDNGDFILDAAGHKIPSPQGYYCRVYCDDIIVVSAKRWWRRH
eukprot:COSAG01_NODE_2199_length_8180_cov_7.460262_9_plen_334_part_00